MGGITIPLALVLLGASFAQLEMPRPLSRLPWAAMILTTAAKMALLPVIGVFLVQAMTNAGFVDRKALALRFVMMFLSGTPTAVKCVESSFIHCVLVRALMIVCTSQLIVSSLYSPDGQVDTLAVRPMCCSRLWLSCSSIVFDRRFCYFSVSNPSYTASCDIRALTPFAVDIFMFFSSAYVSHSAPGPGPIGAPADASFSSHQGTHRRCLAPALTVVSPYIAESLPLDSTPTVITTIPGKRGQMPPEDR